MKIMVQYLKIFSSVSLLVFLIFALAGCFPSIKGTLLDADSNTPIQGATIQLKDKPQTKTISDSNGFFQTKSYLCLWVILPFDVFWFDFSIYHPEYGLHNKKIFTEDIYHNKGIAILYIRKDSTDANLLK